mmetsp:Transcript_21503/g.21625  ORF Transcript_21503/g.21625 Transcript_21503/m.21625 type:complete len:307 (-) Transcript_21503:166-1086(-)
MFIKKDLRKIDEIFRDEKDDRETLKLSKRSAEFQGSLKVLCHQSKIDSLKNLNALNLYDNALTNLQGIGILSKTPIETLNIGNNKLNMLPLEFGSISSLTTIWLDDNQFEDFPIALCQLKQLETLRLSGNSLHNIPSSISNIQNLKVITLDNNSFIEFPTALFHLPSLVELWLRGNKISQVPGDISLLASSLQLLSLSSNILVSLPENIDSLVSLRKLYINGNKLQKLPSTLCDLPFIEVIIAANNNISEIPLQWTAAWGDYDATSGMMTGVLATPAPSDEMTRPSVYPQSKFPQVNLIGNPFHKK